MRVRVFSFRRAAALKREAVYVPVREFVQKILMQYTSWTAYISTNVPRKRRNAQDDHPGSRFSAYAKEGKLSGIEKTTNAASRNAQSVLRRETFREAPQYRKTAYGIGTKRAGRSPSVTISESFPSALLIIRRFAPRKNKQAHAVSPYPAHSARNEDRGVSSAEDAASPRSVRCKVCRMKIPRFWKIRTQLV